MNTVQTLGTWPNTENEIARPQGVIINGDLTAFFKPDELDLFEGYYIKGTDCPSRDVLSYPVFLGLGNHDYANNVNDCWWLRGTDYLLYGDNGCARRAGDYIKGMISCGTVEGFDSSLVESFDVDSLAYSWNMGSYHFVQLHNYPTYTIGSTGSQWIRSSLRWLGHDLSRATQAGRKIVINLHDFGDHFTDTGEFLDMLEASTVVALFAGHTNGLGYQGNLPGTDIPYFRGGHAGTATRNKFLLVEFADSYFNVATIDSLVRGDVRFHDSSDPKYLMKVDHPAPPEVSLEGPDLVQEGDSAAYSYTLTAVDPTAVTFVAGYPDCGINGELRGTPRISDGEFYCNFPDGPAGSEVSLVVTDRWKFPKEQWSVSIQNVAPTAEILGSQGGRVIDENGVATISGTITDPGRLDTFEVVIDWGEGVPVCYSYPAGTTAFPETRQYLNHRA